MANNKIANNENKATQLAPIFVNKSKELINNNINVFDKSVNKMKRKKKSKTVNNKVIKKFDNNTEHNSPSVECRRSRRLRDKEMSEKVVDFCEDSEDNNHYNCLTQTSETTQTITEIKTKTNVSLIVGLNEENSNTIEYWNQMNKSSEDSDDIQVVYYNTSNSSSQESVKTCLPSTQSTEEQKESLLWTEKYKPNNSLEVFGHKTAVNRLKSWLEDWNNSYNRVDDKHEDESYECFDESDTCLLICGPTGSGKTSMVYAIAEELKYEVLELSASVKRNGRIVSKIVSEATQSHHMQRSNDCSQSNSIVAMFGLKNDNNITDSEVKVEKVVKPLKSAKKCVKNKGILNYFKKQNTTESVKSNPTQTQGLVGEEEIQVLTKFETALKVSNDSVISSPKVLSLTSNSLILLDDVDVMIDEDSNSFWTAVNRINEITKKPVILTATQFVPYIKDCVNRLKVLTLKAPDHCETVNALKNICDQEINKEVEQDIDVNVCEYLSNTYSHDIRRCVNELQFGWDQWTHFETQSHHVTEDELNSNSFYDTLVFSDLIKTKFNLLSNSENRELWMKCKPTLIEDENQSICLAKDIINSVNELNNKINSNSPLSYQSNESLAIESQSIESISQWISRNTSLQTILLDYCPYLSFICEAESKRQSETANHSRRSRRFMHHLDSIGFYIDNNIKNELISTFVSEHQSCASDENFEVINETINLIDSDFYD